MEKLQHPKYRPDIDGLRAIAVLSVVAFHAAPKFAPGGFVGVDIFFVISGFLISNIIFASIEKGSFSFREFYVRRVKRIFPSLMLVLLACLVAGKFLLLADEYKQLGKQVVAGTAFVSNILLWSQAGYFDRAADLKPLLHLWSLGIEEQYYLVWPPLVLLVWKLRLRIWGMLALVFLVSFGINIMQVHTNLVSAFYLPFGRMWELTVGGMLSFAMLRTNDSPSALWVVQKLKGNNSAWLGLILIVVSVAVLDKTSQFPGWWALLPTFGAMLLIAAGPEAMINRMVLSNPAAIFVGLISYPLYLWHWPLLSFARIVRSGEANPRLVAILVATSIVLAWFTYWLLETPVRSAQGLRVPAMLAATALLICCAGAYIDYTNGGWRVYEMGVSISGQDLPKAPMQDSDLAVNPALAQHTSGDLHIESENEPVHVRQKAAGRIRADEEPQSLEASSKAEGEPKAATPPQPEKTPEVISARQQDQFLWVERGENADPACIAEFQLDSYPDNKCKIFDINREPTVTLLGDSHANAMYLGFAKYFAGKGENLVNLGRGGCLGFWDVQTEQKGTPPAECGPYMDRILDLVMASKSIRTVLFADYTEIYKTSGSREVISPQDPGNQPGSETYVNEFVKTIRKFQARGKEVLVVMDTPDIEIDPHLCIGRPLSGGPAMAKCAGAQALVEKRMAEQRQLKIRVINSFQHLKYIDVSEAFCDGADCWVMKDNLLLFRDGSHLSHDGSLYFAPFVRILSGPIVSTHARQIN